MRECYTGRLGTVRRGADACSPNSYRPPSWGTTMDITEPWATRPVDPPVYLLSRWLFLRLLGAVYLVAFVSLAVPVPGLPCGHGILPARSVLERVHALYGGAGLR